MFITISWQQSIDGMTFVFRMGYDSMKRLVDLTYPDGELIERHYADAGYLEKVTMDDSLIVDYGRFEGDEYGDIQSLENKIYRKTGNGVKTEVTFNPANYRPVTVKTGISSTYDDYEDHAYTFDKTGNILAITDNLNASASLSVASSDITQGRILWFLNIEGDFLKRLKNSLL